MTKHLRPLTRSLLVAFAAIFAATALVSCGGKAVPMPDDTSPREEKETILRADLLGKGGAVVRGSVSIAARKDRWVVSVNATGAPPGDYRVVFFDNGNCSSPNAFSAGKLWAPPGTPADPAAWIPLLAAEAVGKIQTIARLPNPEQQSVAVFKNRSVLIFSGRGVKALKPGEPNEVVACGVFVTPPSLLDPLGDVF